MVSFEVRRTLKSTARILMLAAVTAPYAGFSQPALEPSANDEQQRQIVEKIQRTASQDGPNSADLIAPLTTLGLLSIKNVGSMARRLRHSNAHRESCASTTVLSRSIRRL
jgi:hypothetical protein